jgi:hypothetical protein
MQIQDFILKQQTRLIKIIGIPILSFFAFIIYAFFRGMNGRKYEAAFPTILKLGLPLWSIFIISLIFFIFCVCIIRLFLNRDIDESTKIYIDSRGFVVDTPDYKMTFKRSKSEIYKISISRFWGLLYPKFYRIGKIKIKYEGDRYCFLFPLRNMEIEDTIKNLCQ